MTRFAVLPGIFLMTFASGCFYQLRDELTEAKISCANHFAAKTAYREMDTACMGLDCPHSFKEGFFQGYKDVANGGTGCVPAVPNVRCCNHMWLDLCTDAEKMEAWYDGYEHGAMAAKCDGMTDYNRITTRVPQAMPIEYSMPGASHSDSPAPKEAPQEAGMGSADSEIPPAPVSESDEEPARQTRRLPAEIFE